LPLIRCYAHTQRSDYSFHQMLTDNNFIGGKHINTTAFMTNTHDELPGYSYSTTKANLTTK